MPDRRQFIAGVSAGVSLPGLYNDPTGSVPIGKRTAENASSGMKLSLAAYSFNRLFARRGTADEIAAAKMSLEKFIDFCVEQQLGAAELTGYYFPKVVTPEYLMAIKNKVHRFGIDISGTAIGNDFCLPNGQARDAQIADCKQWIDYAAMLGAPVIRIFAGKVPKGDSLDASIDRCVAGINECLEYAATKGVILALENHGGITATPGQMLAIIGRVEQSPWFGVNFDSGNFRTDDPYGDLAKIAPLAVNAQIKVSMFQSDNQKQSADLQRVINILKDANYRGYVTLEFEEDDPFEEIPKYLDQLRKLIQ